MTDGYGVLLGIVIAILLAMAGAAVYDAGRQSTRADCETYGKAKVGRFLIDCTVTSP